jgi:hypothetical protein
MEEAMRDSSKVAIMAIVLFVTLALSGQTPRRIGLAVPPTPTGVLTTLGELSVRTRMPLGIEVVSGRGQPPRDAIAAVPKAETYYDLNGLSLDQALDAIVKFKVVGDVQSYEWSSTAGVRHFRPQSFRNNRAVALNRFVQLCEIDVATADGALAAVHRLFDARYAAPTLRTSTHMPYGVRPFFNKHIALSMRNTTVREILDEIVRQYGDASWVAQYVDAGGGYAGMTLRLIGFDKWQASASARIH